MPILAHYEVVHNGETVVVLLTEKDAAKLGAKLADLDYKMQSPPNKMREPQNKADST